MKYNILVGIFLLFLFFSISSSNQNSQKKQEERIRKEILLNEAWLRINAKPCPNCGVPIIKNGGCDYVVCPCCNYGFCYNCFGKHHVGKCNRPAGKPNWRNFLEDLPS